MFCLLLHSLQVWAQSNFGTPYLTQSNLCKHWKCINDKLGLPYQLPPREQFDIALRSLLPDGAWQDVAETVINACYVNRTKWYTNTCPAQALLHCVVDNMHEYCPDSYQRKNDTCSPVTSFASMKYMFSQSRYLNMANTDFHHDWFLKHYFKSKCCDLPILFNSTVLNECGFDSVIRYHEHTPKIMTAVPYIQSAAHSPPLEKVSIVNPDLQLRAEPEDPLNCCDMSNFIEPSWREECDFTLYWDSQSRLTIVNQTVHTTTQPPTTTPAPVRANDVRVVPLTCEKETCVFTKLSVLSATGDVDLDAFTRFLDNFTNINTEWSKAKARAITECLHKPLLGYEEQCEINKILACTLDVLSENCPNHDRKNDPCKSSSWNATCQISSSKYRPKNRRTVCDLPSLVSKDVLEECNLTSLTATESVPVRITTKSEPHWENTRCQDSTESAKCIMGKMNVINKYGFMDYFRMKERIRTASQGPWYMLQDIYTSAFITTPMYKQHCNSPKKLLNVIDAMLTTCPVSKRRSSPQCDRFFSEVIYPSPHDQRNATNENLQHTLAHFPHVFIPPAAPRPIGGPFVTFPTYDQVHYRVNPYYNFGILSSGGVPAVRTINVPSKATRKPLVMLPMYLRVKDTSRLEEPRALPFRNGLLRSGPLPPVTN